MDDESPTPDEELAMTSPDVPKIKAIAALLEAIDSEDEDDAKQVLKMIRGLLEPAGKQS